MAYRYKPKYGRKSKVTISETTAGMSIEMPMFECKGRRTRVGYKMIQWMIGHGYLRYGDLLHIVMFKNFEEFHKANGDKEIQIKLVSKEE